MKRIYIILFALLPINVLLAQNMQPSNLIKTPLNNIPNESVAVLKNPLMFGEGNPYSGGHVQGAIQIVTPLADFMFDVEGTIMRFGPGWQEKIRFHLNAYGWSGSGTVNYTANPIKAFWEKRLPDLQELPVTLGNLSVDGGLKTTITIGNGNTVWGSYMVVVIDKVYLTNQSAGNYLFDDSRWQVSKVSQVNTTNNVSTVFGAAPFPKATVNEAIDGQSLASGSIVQAGQFRAMNGANVIGAPNANYWNILSLRHSNPANDYRMEIAGDFYANDIKFRNTNNNPSQGWNTFFHSGNTDYARTALGLPANPLRSHKAVDWIVYPGADANTIEENTSSFTYNLNAPTVGPLAHFGNSGYGLQLNAPYSGTGALHFRTRNGDISNWNEWKPLVYEGFGYTWGLNINGSANKWNDNTFNLGEVAAPTYFVTGVGNSAWGYSSASQLKTSLGLPTVGGYALDDVAGRGNSLSRDIAFSASNNIGLKWTYGGDLSSLYYNNGANGNGKVVLDIGDDNMLSQGFQIRGVSYDSVINEVAYFSANGNVGIGTTTPTEKLAVNGKIRAREVKVEPVNGWPDYVFDDNYKPLSLAEVSAFVKKHKHLPEVPSTKEIEQNGLELGEMNKILLKKIEELTLHLIEKDEQMNVEKTINKQQGEQIIVLQQQYQELRRLIKKSLKN